MAFFENGVQLGPERWRAADTVEVLFKGGKGDQGRIGAGHGENERGEMGWRSGGERRGFVGGAVRVLRVQYTGAGERPFDGLQERGRVKSMGGRTSEILPQERAGEGGGEVEIARESGSGGTETGGVRAALGEDRGSN